ncbi:MAG: hypothetical protein R3Y58_03425 [Eubacteriales bacterium]
MKESIKPTFVNIILIGGKEVDFKSLSADERSAISNSLNLQGMSAIGYQEIKTA